MQNLILAKSNIINVSYRFSSLNIVVKSFEEACFVLYNDVILNKNEVFRDEFITFLDNIELSRFSKMLKDDSLSETDRVVSLLFYSDMFSVEQLENIKQLLIDFEKEPLWLQYKRIAKEYAKQNNIVQALKFYKLALSKNIDVDLLSNIGYLYKILKKYDFAIKYFEKAITMSFNKFICENLFDCYIVTKNIDGLRLILTKAESLLDEDKVLYYKAEVMFLESKSDNHLELYKAAYDINQNEKYALKIADYYINKRQYVKASEFIEECANTVLVVIKKAEILSLCENSKKAMQYLESILLEYDNHSLIVAEILKYKRVNYDVLGAKSFVGSNNDFDQNNKHILFETARINKALGGQKEYSKSLSLLLELYKDEYRIST